MTSLLPPLPFLPARPSYVRPLFAPLLALLAALVPSPLAPTALAQEVQLEGRVFEIARGLRCPVCTSESVADSSSGTAIEMRAIIQEQLEAGRTEEQILAFFEERYGAYIRLEPPKRGIHLWVWLLPAVAALLGAAALAWLVRRWTAATRTPVEADEADVRRVREMLDRREAEGSSPGSAKPGSGGG